MIESMSGIALQGLNDARMKMQKNASDIAAAGTDLKNANDVNVASSLVEMKINEKVAEANIKVIKAEDEMLGTLLDEKA